MVASKTAMHLGTPVYIIRSRTLVITCPPLGSVPFGII